MSITVLSRSESKTVEVNGIPYSFSLIDGCKVSVEKLELGFNFIVDIGMLPDLIELLQYILSRDSFESRDTEDSTNIVNNRLMNIFGFYKRNPQYKIHCIKDFRDVTGCGLKDSKEWIEAFEVYSSFDEFIDVYGRNFYEK